jgi:hypothetical protein
VLKFKRKFWRQKLSKKAQNLCKHIAKFLNIIPVLDKIQDYRRNWKIHVNRMTLNRLPKIIKLQTKRQKELGQTIEETSG